MTNDNQFGLSFGNKEAREDRECLTLPQNTLLDSPPGMTVGLDP